MLARDGVVVGVGAGQMSRVESARIASARAGERARGAVCASDAFFPFADGVEVCLDAGVTAFVQPGGSKRDEEVIAAADCRRTPRCSSPDGATSATDEASRDSRAM